MASDHDNSKSTREGVGLCSSCRFMLEQVTKRGTVFFRCARADEDARFNRYPTIPVLRCDGFESGGFEGNDHWRGEVPGME
jgi:hypothetical protein